MSKTPIPTGKREIVEISLNFTYIRINRVELYQI